MLDCEVWSNSLVGSSLFNLVSSVVNNQVIFNKNYLKKSAHLFSHKNFWVEICFKKLNYRKKVKRDIRYVCKTCDFIKFIDLISTQDIVYIFFLKRLLWCGQKINVHGINLWFNFIYKFERKDDKKNLIVNKKYWNDDYEHEFECHRGEIV